MHMQWSEKDEEHRHVLFLDSAFSKFAHRANLLIKNGGFRTEYKYKELFCAHQNTPDWWLISCLKIKQGEKLAVNISQLQQGLKGNILEILTMDKSHHLLQKQEKHRDLIASLVMVRGITD